MVFPRQRYGKQVHPVDERLTNSTRNHGTASVMRAWTAGIQASRDASGPIPVNLGSGTPCRNDDTEANTQHRKTVAWSCASTNTSFQFLDNSSYEVADR